MIIKSNSFSILVPNFGEYMKKHLEYADERSNKFWEIELKGKTINICYGRIGIQNPATQKKSFPSTDLAKKYYEKKLREKLNKGYH